MHLQPNSAVSTRNICWIIGPIYSVQDKTKFPDSFVPVSCELLFFFNCNYIWKFQAGVTPLEDNESFDQYHYEITVYTGFGKRAGTTAEVNFILSGDEGESEPRLLKDPKRKTFQRRGVDVFLATFPESFGELNYLHLWHNNGGKLFLVRFFVSYMTTFK